MPAAKAIINCTRCKISISRHERRGSSWMCSRCHATYKREWRKTRRARGAPIRSFIAERFSNYRCRARYLKVPFDLTIDYLDQLWKAQNGKCFYTEEPMIFFGGSEAYADGKTASVDRLNPELGYVCGNVAWVCFYVNNMKRLLSHDKFVEVCKLIGNKLYALPGVVFEAIKFSVEGSRDR